MSAFDAGTVRGSLDLDTTRFEHGFSEAHTHAETEGGRIREVLESLVEVLNEALGPAVAQFAQSLQSAFAGFSEGPIVGTLGAIATAVGAVREAVEGAGGQFHQMGLEALKAGVSAEFLSRLSAVGGTVGVSLDQLGVGFKILEQRAEEAAEGNKAATEGYQRLGISAQQAGELAKDPQALFEAVQQSIGRMRGAAERNTAALGVMGRQGANLVPLFQMSREEFEKTADQMERMGGTMSAADVEMGESLGKLEGYFHAAFLGIERAVSKPVLAYLEKHMDQIEPMIESAVGKLVSVIEKAWDILSAIFDEIGPSAESTFGAVASVIETVAQVIHDLFIVALAACEVAVMDVIAALKELANGPFKPAFEWLENVFQRIGESIQWAIDKIKYLIDALHTLAGTPNLFGSDVNAPPAAKPSDTSTAEKKSDQSAKDTASVTDTTGTSDTAGINTGTDSIKSARPSPNEQTPGGSAEQDQREQFDGPQRSRGTDHHKESDQHSEQPASTPTAPQPTQSTPQPAPSAPPQAPLPPPALPTQTHAEPFKGGYDALRTELGDATKGADGLYDVGGKYTGGLGGKMTPEAYERMRQHEKDRAATGTASGNSYPAEEVQNRRGDPTKTDWSGTPDSIAEWRMHHADEPSSIDKERLSSQWRTDHNKPTQAQLDTAIAASDRQAQQNQNLADHGNVLSRGESSLAAASAATPTLAKPAIPPPTAPVIVQHTPPAPELFQQQQPETFPAAPPAPVIVQHTTPVPTPQFSHGVPTAGPANVEPAAPVQPAVATAGFRRGVPIDAANPEPAAPTPPAVTSAGFRRGIPTDNVNAEPAAPAQPTVAAAGFRRGVAQEAPSSPPPAVALRAPQLALPPAPTVQATAAAAVAPQNAGASSQLAEMIQRLIAPSTQMGETVGRLRISSDALKSSFDALHARVNGLVSNLTEGGRESQRQQQQPAAPANVSNTFNVSVKYDPKDAVAQFAAKILPALRDLKQSGDEKLSAAMSDRFVAAALGGGF